MGMPLQIKTENAPAYFSSKMKVFFAYYNIKLITCTPHNPIGQAIIERKNHTLKGMFNKQKGVTKTPREILHSTLLPLKILKIMNRKQQLLKDNGLWEKTLLN